MAYLTSSTVDGCTHIDQVTVAPAHARRGIGAALMRHEAEVIPGDAPRVAMRRPNRG